MLLVPALLLVVVVLGLPWLCPSSGVKRKKGAANIIYPISLSVVRVLRSCS